ncbi:MAG: hypothetical protein ACFFB1_03650 [Promethearchaeota archaeon]
MKEAKLRIGVLDSSRSGRSLCYIDHNVMKKLGLITGNIIEMRGKKKTAGIAVSSISDKGKGIIRLDQVQMLNAGADFGHYITIKPARVYPAQEIVLTRTKANLDIMRNVFAIKAKLIGKPLVVGDFLGAVIVENTNPSDKIVKVTIDTLIKLSKKVAPKKNFVNPNWIKLIAAKENVFNPNWIKFMAAKKKHVHPDWIKAKINEYKKYKSPPRLEKKINQYITLKLEHGRTYIYVNGIRFLQCIRLVLDIQKKDVRLYDEIESIDEAADLYNKHLYQNRIVTGPMARPVLDQTHDITPEEEFWGHCSNIQAWVEHGYDTRILKSNVSFPLLRQLTQAGDPLAGKIFREEIALRLESGYPSVVQYLLNQGYVKYLTPFEFKTILETTPLIENISREPRTLINFLSSCALKFPNLFKDILLKILMLPEGRNNIISGLSLKSKRPYLRYSNRFLITLYQVLEDLLGGVEFQLKKYIIDCISITGKLIEKGLHSPPLPDIYQKFLMNAPFNDLLPEVFMPLEDKIKNDNQILHKFYNSQPKCSYCGKIIPRGLDTCHWCGHNVWT